MIPEQGDVLLVVDVFNDFDHEDGDALLASFRDRSAHLVAALDAARSAGVPVIYVNDQHGRWQSDAPALIRAACEGPGGDVIEQLKPKQDEHVLLKCRYSAFDHTALELLLDSLDVKRVLLAGSTTEGCVVQTAIDARERELQATILAEACARIDADLEEIALRYAEEVGGIRVDRGR